MARVIALLERDHGATIAELIAATGWLAHTTRAALTGLRKRGYAVAIDRSDDKRGSFYRIPAGETGIIEGHCELRDGAQEGAGPVGAASPSSSLMAGRRPMRGAGEGLLRPTPRPKRGLARDDMIAALVELDANGLCLQWRNHLGGTPPAHLPRWLLMKILAYRIQATAFGGLDKETLRVLRQPKGRRLASSDLRPFEAQIATTREGTELKAGALLAREWNGRLEHVMILDQGVAWNGETYASLSQVAKAMTGTSWNGHRFFGLRTAGFDRSAMVSRRSGDCDAAASGAPSTPIKGGGAAFARRASRQAASP